MILRNSLATCLRYVADAAGSGLPQTARTKVVVPGRSRSCYVMSLVLHRGYATAGDDRTGYGWALFQQIEIVRRMRLGQDGIFGWSPSGIRKS